MSYSRDEIEAHIEELEDRYEQFSPGKCGYDYLYGTSLRIIRQLLQERSE